MKWLAAAILTALVLALALAPDGLGAGAGAWRLPERWNPWAPLRIVDAPNLLTRHKLGRLSSDPAACLAVLADSALRHQPVPDREPAPGCAVRNAIRVDRTQLSVGTPFTLSCPAAVSLALWEHHVVLPAALRHFGEPAVRLEHLGSYACRNVYGRDDAPRSRHATGDALDVAGIVLRSGRRVRVAAAWRGEDAAARFLHELRDGACRHFDGVLSPDYNAEHADHLHLDRGPHRVCR